MLTPSTCAWGEMLRTRDRMIEAAAALLDAGGRDGVKLRDIGRMVGLSHNAPYRHFHDKEALLAAIAAKELDRRKESWRRVEQDELSLLDGLVGYVEWASAHPERFLLTYGRWENQHAELTRSAMSAFDAFLAALEAAERKGDLPAGRTRTTAPILLALINGVANLTVAGHFEAHDKGGADSRALLADALARLSPPA